MTAQTPTRSRNEWRQQLLAYALIAPPIIMVFALLLYPALQSFVRTLVDVPGSTGGISFARYEAFFQDQVSINNLIFTIQMTVLSTLGLFLVCFPLALYLRFSSSRIAGWVQSIALFPLFVPGIMLSYALIRFLRPRGMLETFLNLFGAADGYETPYLKPLGIIIGLVWEGIPFTLLILTAGLRQVDNSLIESARDVGANTLQIFWRILLPLTARSALIAFCLNFIGIFGSYTIPYLLGPAAPQMMGIFMQRTFQEFQRPQEAETQAVITFLMCLIVGLLYVYAVTRQRADQR
ncbi:MAG: ABC transporter permease subunit [Chloroflexota bacterium]|nr:ABC transporter permease subunit [Chloroflexota bacterium]